MATPLPCSQKDIIFYYSLNCGPFAAVKPCRVNGYLGEKGFQGKINRDNIGKNTECFCPTGLLKVFDLQIDIGGGRTMWIEFFQFLSWARLPNSMWKVVKCCKRDPVKVVWVSRGPFFKLGKSRNPPKRLQWNPKGWVNFGIGICEDKLLEEGYL